MDYAGFVKAADAGQAPPVTLLHGPEPFLLEDALARLTRALFPGQTELSLVREVFDARAAGAEAMVQSALMLPWIGERRLVIARGVDGLAAKAGESLAAYAKAPNPSTALVLVADALLEGGALAGPGGARVRGGGGAGPRRARADRLAPRPRPGAGVRARGRTRPTCWSSCRATISPSSSARSRRRRWRADPTTAASAPPRSGRWWASTGSATCSS